MSCDSVSFSGFASAQAAPRRFWSTGIEAFDQALHGGFAYGRLHEFYSAEPEDSAAAAGLVAGIAIAATGNIRPIIWLRSRQSSKLCGVIQGGGWAELGGAPETCLFILADDAIGLLRASADAVRAGAGVARANAGVVVIESSGRMPELDLTASRRLSLAAAKSGVLLLLLRADAAPVPSAAETRWAVASASSRARAANAPGGPTFEIELLRHRAGPSGRRWRLEWDRDRKMLRSAAISGAVATVSGNGSGADAADGGRATPASRAA